MLACSETRMHSTAAFAAVVLDPTLSFALMADLRLLSGAGAHRGPGTPAGGAAAHGADDADRWRHPQEVL